MGVTRGGWVACMFWATSWVHQVTEGKEMEGETSAIRDEWKGVLYDILLNVSFIHAYQGTSDE